jgi:hypothetical protein
LRPFFFKLRTIFFQPTELFHAKMSRVGMVEHQDHILIIVQRFRKTDHATFTFWKRKVRRFFAAWLLRSGAASGSQNRQKCQKTDL